MRDGYKKIEILATFALIFGKLGTQVMYMISPNGQQRKAGHRATCPLLHMSANWQ